MELCQQVIAFKNGLVPYSDTDSNHSSEQKAYSQTESENDIEEETCVGKRGYRNKRILPKRLQNKKQRDTSVQPNPCINKKCGNLCDDKFTESDRLAINEHFWGFGNKIRQKDWLLSYALPETDQEDN
ncbi:uncharacterized protein LOC120779524 [Bactrocera tryoni]|uniref:uncharacterized protein LOC120779524 n=1 Tax=Bactrocera tryoni TaxID=59916 RepID=UPI001A95A917|nr:uncharacterized protein LOC120779524 [Bactrocera tryoni]